MFCKRCGTVLKPESHFCSHCGDAVESSSSHAPRFIIFFFTLLCVVLLAGWLGYHLYMMSTESPSQNIEKTAPVKHNVSANQAEETTTDILIAPIEKQLQALKAHEASQAYDGLVSKEFQAQTNLDSFIEFIHNYPILTTFENYEYQAHSIKENQAEVVVILIAGKDHIPLQYHLVQEDGQWKIWQMQIVLPMTDGAFANPLEHPKQLIPIIEGFLTDLRKQKFEQAYNGYTSQAFRNITSSEEFNQFIKNNPIFSEFKTLTIQETVIINEKGKAVIDLLGQEGAYQLYFSLSLEDKQWKIKGIQVTKKDSNDNEKKNRIDEVLDEKTFLPIIKGQLDALKQKDIESAYDSFTSKEFKASTSIEEFQKFVDAHPIFFEFSNLSFPKLTFNNNIATMIGLLEDANGQGYPIEFDLNLDNQQWKILHIQISKPAKKIDKTNNESKTE